MSTAYAVVRCPFVCSSVCLSRSCIVSSTVSLLSIINVCFLLSTMLMNKDYHIIFLNIFIPPGRPTILFLPYQTSWQYSDGGVECRWYEKSRFSTNIWLYYYGTLIGTRMQSSEWCHLQWPWMTPNPDFKVMPLVWWIKIYIRRWISKKRY